MAVSIALALLSAGAIGLWWLLVPHVLSALTLGLIVRGRPALDDPGPRRGWGAAAGVAAAVLVLSLANDLATTSGRAFLPRWE